MIDYSLDEVKAVIATHAMDIYHRELLQWLVRQHERMHTLCEAAALIGSMDFQNYVHGCGQSANDPCRACDFNDAVAAYRGGK